MKHIAALFALAALGSLAQPVLAQSSNTWTPMRHVNPAKDARPAQQVADLWKSQVSSAPSWGLNYQTYKDGDTSVTVMLGLQNDCDNGPNSITSEQTWSTCPLRVVVTTPQGTKTVSFDNACYLHVDPAEDPTAPDPRLNGNFTQYDPSRKVLTVRTLANGAPVPECTKTIQLQ